MVRILIADDHEVIRRGLRQMIERHGKWSVCGEATSGAEALELARELKPDIVILDVSMPNTDSVELTRRLREALPSTEVLIFTMHEGEEMIRALVDAGARGYTFKSDTTAQILTAIEMLAGHKPFFTAKVSEALREAFLKSIASDAGKPPASFLSAREREVIQLLAESKSNKEVATRLGISVKTVETHRATIMRKLGINSVVELVHYAVRNKMISP
jgi:DNA-binding NarL/FixJ family response regulator